MAAFIKIVEKFKHTASSQSAMLGGIDFVAMHRRWEETIGKAMRAFIKRFLMHYGIYRRYPLGRLPAFRNAWRNARA